MSEVIVLTEQLYEDLKSFFKKNIYTQIAVLVDTNTLHFCYPLIQKYLPNHTLIKISAGEKHKNLTSCQQIWLAMTKAGLDRDALLLNLGGGLIGDIGGFCAATFKRGIDFIQIPTTLLAQVDASVGGKVGINFKGLKNHLGVFQQPKAIFIDPIFLKTLPQREILAGFAEILKHCLIADKIKWLEITQKPFYEQKFTDLIAHSIKIKQNIVAQDPHEKGLRKILNFGHTVGHALESLFLNASTPLLHGEAVALGMVAEAYLSYKKNYLMYEQFLEIKTSIKSCFVFPELRKEYLPKIKKLILQDKKNIKGAIQCVLLKDVGKAIYNKKITWEEIIECLENI